MNLWRSFKRTAKKYLNAKLQLESIISQSLLWTGLKDPGYFFTPVAMTEFEANEYVSNRPFCSSATPSPATSGLIAGNVTGNLTTTSSGDRLHFTVGDINGDGQWVPTFTIIYTWIKFSFLRMLWEVQKCLNVMGRLSQNSNKPPYTRHALLLLEDIYKHMLYTSSNRIHKLQGEGGGARKITI